MIKLKACASSSCSRQATRLTVKQSIAHFRRFPEAPRSAAFVVDSSIRQSPPVPKLPKGKFPRKIVSQVPASKPLVHPYSYWKDHLLFCDHSILRSV